MRQRGAAVRPHVGVAAVVLDHLRAHADDVADLRVRQASAAQVGHRRCVQAVQREALQFRNRIARLGKLPGEFLARERLAILLTGTDPVAAPTSAFPPRASA
jgi:hypothetical protein